MSDQKPNKKKEITTSNSLDFIQRLMKNDAKAPNEFTKLLGEFIREAREEKKMSQAELAEKICRRVATISEIENGKSDISIQTLLVLAIALQKPISYFFPKSLIKDLVMDVTSPFQQKGLELLTEIEYVGDHKLTLDILKTLSDHFDYEFEHRDDPGFPEEEDIA